MYLGDGADEWVVDVEVDDYGGDEETEGCVYTVGDGDDRPGRQDSCIQYGFLLRFASFLAAEGFFDLLG